METAQRFLFSWSDARISSDQFAQGVKEFSELLIKMREEYRTYQVRMQALSEEITAKIKKE